MEENGVGIAFLLGNAGRQSERKERHSFRGDLSQMAAQARFLEGKGFDVFYSDVYPCVGTKEEFERAVKLIKENSVEGHWHY